MEFVINVVKNHRHYFRVTVPYGSVKTVYEELKEKFADCELSVTEWQKIGKSIDMEKCNF